jgi:hypothetical protein
VSEAYGEELATRAQAIPQTSEPTNESLWSLAGVMFVVGLFYAISVRERLHQAGALWFVHFGRQFLAQTHSTVVTTHLPSNSQLGYDGQYYYAIAADPRHAHDYLTGGNAGYLYSRPMYPFLSRVLSGGSLTALPYTMIVINFAAIMVGTFAVALWLRARSVSPWFAIVYGLWPGLVFSMFRDLTEPLAFGLVAVGVLAFDPTRTRRVAVTTVLFALALLTRETVVPFVVAAVVTLALTDRRLANRSRGSLRFLRRPALMLLGCCLPLVVWRFVISSWLASSTQEQGGGLSWAIPFHGLWAYWHFDEQHWLIALTIVLPVLGISIAALWKGLPRRAPVVTGLLFLNALLFVVFLPKEVYVDYAAAARAAIGVVLAAIFCTPAFAASGIRRPSLVAGAFLLSIGWYIIVAAALGISALALITE